MAQDIDFSRMLRELDDPPSADFGPLAEPSQAARDAFDLPGSTRKLIDDVVSTREADRRQSDYVEQGKAAVSALTDPQQYKEFAKGIVPGAISMGGTAIQAPDAITAKGQQGAAKFGRKQLEIMDRIDRGEAVPEMEDPIGYAYMSQEQRQAARRDQEQATAEFKPTPMAERPFFKAGEKVQKFAKDLMPAAPGYEESVGRQLGEGMGSMAFGLPLAYFGGPAVAGTAFGSAGIGEATQRAVEFDRKEKAAGRPGLTEDQIATAGILGVGPGATDLLPVEVLIGRLPLPVPPALRRPLAMAIGRIGGQAFIEGAQEGGQAFLQNLIAREVYNPSQPLVDGIEHEMGIGAGVGGIAQTAKELGVWMLKSGAIRKKKGVHDSLVEHEKAQKEAAEATPSEDARTLAPSQEGETPRLKKGEASVRGPSPSSEPAIQDAERLLDEIGQGTIAQGSAEPAVAPTTEESGRTDQPTEERQVSELGRQSVDQGTPDAPAPPVTEAPAAVSTEPATTPATAPRSLTEAIQQAAPQIEQAVQEIADLRTQGTQTRETVNQLTDETRARFAEVLASKERRSNWGKAAGVTEEQVQSLIQEAVADGRLTVRKGQPVRTAKARQAPATPQAEVARAATSVPMGRAAEVRLEKITSDVAYKHAAAILGAGSNRAAALAKLASDKKATRAVLDEIHQAVTGKPSKSLRTKGAVLEALAKVEEAATSDRSSTVEHGNIPEKSESPAEVFTDAGKNLPPADSYAIRSLQSIEDPVAREHARALIDAGTNVEDAIGAMLADRRVSPEERAQIAEAYVGTPIAVQGDGAQDRIAAMERLQSRAKGEEKAALTALLGSLRAGRIPPLRLRQEQKAASLLESKAPLAQRALGTTYWYNIVAGDASLGEFSVTIAPGGTRAYVESIHLPDHLKAYAGRGLLRDLRGLFHAEFPKVTTFFGDRSTGARARSGNVRQEIRWLMRGSDAEADPALQAIRDAAAQRGRDITSALLHGFSPEISPSNLRVRDFDAQMLETALQRLAERLPREALLVARNVLRFDIGTRVAALEGATLSPEAALSGFGIEAGIAKKIIAVSLEYGPDVALQTFTHEEIHLLRQLGILKGKDWEALAGVAKRRPKKAEATRILDSLLAGDKIDQETYDSLIAQAGKLTYRELYQIDARYGEFLKGNEDLLVEETVAHVAADWAQGREFAAPIERALQKIRDFIEAIQNLIVNGIGARSANDIFESIWAGELTRKFEEAAERRFATEERGIELMRREDVTALATDGASMFAFAGERAKTADLEALAAAKRMESEGKSREFIWTETGWFRGVDGRWRFEIDDSKSKLRAFAPELSLLHVELTHDPLFEAYPQLLDIELNRVSERGFRGQYVAGKNLIPPSIELSKYITNRRSTVLHESQHALQDIERFAEGGNPDYELSRLDPILIIPDEAQVLRDRIDELADEAAAARAAGDTDLADRIDEEADRLDIQQAALVKRKREFKWQKKARAFSAYQRLAGEVEARTVQRRMNLTADEREERPPWLDYDVPEDQQIVRMPVEGGPAVPRLSTEDNVSQQSYSAEPPIGGHPTLAKPRMIAIRAFHGTPHLFERFSMEAIGKGEGAQAFGHGLYFAQNENVARWYQERLGDVRRRIVIEGEEYRPRRNSAVEWAVTEIAERSKGHEIVKKETIDGIIDELYKKFPLDKRKDVGVAGSSTDAIHAAGTIRQLEGKRVEFNQGRMYEVALDVDQSKLLDWDKPLEEQAAGPALLEQLEPELRAGLEEMLEERDLSPDLGVYTGREFYQLLQRWASEDALPGVDTQGDNTKLDASLYLRSKGVPGLHYLDQNSRSGGVGTSNFVIFDDSLVRIVSRDGQPVIRQEIIDALKPREATEETVAQNNMMFALRDWMPSRKPTPPQSTPEDESPGLNKIISDLKKTMGMTVSQGLWGFSVQQGNRSARVRPPSNVRGQFDRQTGNISVRQSRDIKTLAHEGGHYLESILGTDLGAIKQRFAQALTGDPAPMPAALSEGFANWFRDYILDPDAAEARAPGMTEAFDELLEAERPEMLEGFDTIQKEYQRYIKSAPIGEVATGLSSQYDGTTWRELSKDKALDNVSGKLSTAYQGAIDGLNVAAKGISYLLKTADANGIRDEEGRPISVKVGDNFYKRLRLFAGSFNRGRVWLDKGVSDLTTGRIIGPSLKDALEKALGGGKFNMQRYKDFNQYLVSIRAIAEYDRLDQKAATVKQYDDTIAKLADARPMLAERLQKDAATLERRQDALTRANAMLADRRRMLGVAETRLENIQERLDGVLADIAEAGEMGALAQDIADPLAENAVSENYGAMVARRRRQVQNLERQQREAIRAVERLSEEVSGRDVEVGMLQEEIRQLSEGVAAGRQRMAQLDDASARLRKERELASNRGASRPPTAEPRAVHERVIKELGTPEFQEAAKLVHDFTFSLLEARRQAGFITQEMFDELAKRKDWYVPFWRDMSDIEGAGAMFPGSGVKKWSMFKKFDGSDRSILMPLEILSEEAYSTAQQIAFNDMVKAMVGLAERVGPGGGKVAERLARAENMEANEETFGKIRQMAIDLGVDEIDAHMITQRMEMNFSDGDIRVIMSPENLGPTAKPQLPMWENGERIMVRLPDPAFGRDLFEAINGLGKEMSDILVKALALPAQALRVGVTSHPDFIFRNIWRDIWTAWKLTGAAPFVTQFRGFALINERGTVDGMSGEDFLRLYNEAGGIAGGINVNAQIADQRRDVKALLDTNIDPKAIAGGAALGGFTGLAAGSSIGSLMGMVFGGPVGAAVGFKIGATVGGLVGGFGTGYAARHGEVWRFVESFETATRLGVAAHAYKRAKAHNPDLSDMEAITEAAYVSRDIMDWNRRGSKMLAATRLVTFLNAQIQGLDKQLRQMTAQGDRGSALKKQLAIVFKHQSNDILSRDEQRDLADAYKSYLRWGAITLMLMGLAALYADDDDYQDIKDETKATHSWFKALGIWFRLPKPFELAVPGNIGEIVWDKVAGRDQRMGERIVDSMYEVLAPPGLPQVMRLTGGLLFNRDRQGIFSGRSREIVGENLASRPPHERYHAFSSEFAIDLSRAMYLAGVPQSLIPAPVKTDFVLSAAGAYWGREVQNSYQTAKTMVGMSTRPDRKATDFPILRGFTGEAARMSRGVNDMWAMISRDGGEFTMAATEYKQLMDDRGRPVEAEMWLKSLDPEQRVWALTQYYGSRSEKREHPLERASQADRINREIMRDTISDTLAPKVRQGRKTVRDYDEKIELTPAKKTEVIDILARLSQVEARNTMILMKRPGFEGMDVKDPQLIIDELKSASPQVHDLLLERRDKKVADWPDVVKEWPKYRDRVLKESVGAF